MQSSLLASEDRRKELETGIEVIQTTLRRTMSERDDARRTVGHAGDNMPEQLDARPDPAGRGRIATVAATLDRLADALMPPRPSGTDGRSGKDRAMREADELAHELRLLEERNDRDLRQPRRRGDGVAWNRWTGCSALPG